MAVAVLTNAYINISSNIVSTNSNQIAVDIGAADVESTTFGSVWETHLVGLLNASGNIGFVQDFAVSGLDSIMWALFIARAAVSFEFRGDAGAVSTSNPKYTGNLLILGWPPLGNSIGELATVKMPFKVSGAITRATS